MLTDQYRHIVEMAPPGTTTRRGLFKPFGGGAAMKYLCLIYDNEGVWQKFSQEVRDKYMVEYTAFGDSI
jgi:hypothetical protein